MKKLLLAAVVLLTTNAFAGNLRDECENAYYADAGGVTKLHHYSVVFEYGRFSDWLLDDFEDLTKGQSVFEWVSDFDFDYKGRVMTSMVIKEKRGTDRIDAIIALKELQEFPGVRVRCK